MFPFYEIFHYRLASYGTLIVLGLLLGIFISYLLVRKNQPELKEDVIYAFLIASLGVAIGGKLLFILVSSADMINLVKQQVPVEYIAGYILQGGFVFYGSMIGAVMALYIYAKAFHVSLERLIYYLTPAIPLIHSIGRIGCLAAGCCYGIPMKSFGYQLNKSLTAPHHITLFPTQLLESVFCFLIFMIVLLLFKKIKHGYRLFAVYILLYAPFRFFIEFYRGDIERGFIGFFSTSQIISLLLFIPLFIIFCFFPESFEKITT